MVQSLTLIALVLAACELASAGPWDLRSYKRCDFLKQKNIRSELSGVTYSAETGTVWTVTRQPMVFSEYTLPEGKFLRDVPSVNLDLRDPEGITWMYDYTFAVSQEASPFSNKESMITIFRIEPWKDQAIVIRKLIIPIYQMTNQGLEGLSWDPTRQVLIAGQEKPMKAWQIDPETGNYGYILKEAKRTKDNLWDFAGVYRRAGDLGLYVMSEPTKMIFHLDKNGEEIKGQVLPVTDASLPEGITFTPDGALLIAVGEPNEMFIYSSTGSCNWSPGAVDPLISPATGSSTTKSSWSFSSMSPDKSSLSASSVPSSDPLTQKNPGSCSWTQCGPRALVNIPWCSASIDTCVSNCGGWWCSNTFGVPPITEEIWAKLSSPPAPAVAWFEDQSLGFCSAFNGCDGGEQSATPWCAKTMKNCLACKGTWCPKSSVEGDVEPITQLNSTQATAEAPAPAPAPAPIPPAQDSVEASASTTVKWFEDPSQGYCNYNGCDGVLKGAAWCLKSQSNCNGCQGTWCPKGNLAGQVVPIPPSDKSGQDSPDDDAEGYQAMVSLMLDDTPDPELMTSLKEAAAVAAYGSEDAVVSVTVLDDAQDAATRRLQGVTAPQQSHVVIVLNGETDHHATVLALRLERDVGTGQLRHQVQARAGGADVGEMTVEYSVIMSAGKPPRQFPVVHAVVPEEVPEILLHPQSCLSNPAVLAAIVCGACAVLAGIISAVVCVCIRRRNKSTATVADSSSSGASDTQPPSKAVPVEAPAAPADSKGGNSQKSKAVDKLPL